ncbi:TBC domain-containing protein [Escovopsis weberi]|uniref:TBC domain-containing protein n=1 Tax=Escovopsis weberi TaxID=150374 RepID=A0A0M8N0W4_ESCWE|nr:TBC domain-containing protein [Escovopsis weberi]
MDLADAISLPLQRTVSSQSSHSLRSHRSTAAAAASSSSRAHRSRKLVSQPSSSASSIIAPSDKSLTSFPSFSPEPFGHDDDDADADADCYKNGRGRHHDHDHHNHHRLLRPGAYDPEPARRPRRDTSGRRSTIVDSLTWRSSAREALFEDPPVSQTVPGALHRADDEHIERLVARHGAVALVRQIAGDLAQRDAHVAAMRRRADERETALRRIIRDCGLSNLDLETRLRAVEAELRDNNNNNNNNNNNGGGPSRGADDPDGLSDLMSDAMQDVMAENVYGETGPARDNAQTIRASAVSLASTSSNHNVHHPQNLHHHDGGGKGAATSRGWRDYIWGGGTTKKLSLVNGNGSTDTAVLRPHSGSDRRSILNEDFFQPPTHHRARKPATNPSASCLNLAADAGSVRSSSRGSSVYSASRGGETKGSTSLASLALRLVAGGAIASRESETRGRAASSCNGRAASVRADSVASNNTTKSGRAVSVAGGPKALMAMRRSAANVTSAPAGSSMAGSPPGASSAASRPEAYGPVEMDAILPPESQPPTLTHMYHNYPNCEYLTDRYGFIYDQRRKKRQREAAQMVQHIRKGSRTELLGGSGRTDVVPNSASSLSIAAEDLPSPKWSVSSDQGVRPESPGSVEERVSDEGRAVKRWQDYLRIATIPTELLSHTPGISALTVVEAAGTTNDERPQQQQQQQQQPPPSSSSGEAAPRSPAITAPAIAPPAITPPEITPAVITPTQSAGGLLPPPATATAIDSSTSDAKQSCWDHDATGGGTLVKEDAEPVKMLLEQLSDMHDSLQRDKTVRWNDFLRKVRAERRREGEAAIAAAAAAAEARYERPAVILPETRVLDGEMIGISNLGNKGKVGRAKWNEFKSLVLGGIPVAYRAKVWAECSGATTLRVPGYYEDLVSGRSRDDDDDNGGGGGVEEDDPEVVTQIEMDIRRTLTDNIFFRNGPGVGKLNEVLLAYSRRNRDVGYCQGMNLIAANLLLMTPTAEDAFWILASIVERILPAGYYDGSLMSSRADQQVLRHFVGTVLPRLSAHLDALAIELEALTFQWFLSVFTDCLCAEALFRVWDVVLCTNDGSTFLFQVALALLKLNESNLLACDTPAAVYTYINHQMTEHAISIDGLIQASEGLRRVVRREDVEQRREQVMRAERERMAERVAKSGGDGGGRKANNNKPGPCSVDEGGTGRDAGEATLQGQGGEIA